MKKLMEVIDRLLVYSGFHGLQSEVLASFILALVKASPEQLERAATTALNEWDL